MKHSWKLKKPIQFSITFVFLVLFFPCYSQNEDEKLDLVQEIKNLKERLKQIEQKQIKMEEKFKKLLVQPLLDIPIEMLLEQIKSKDHEIRFQAISQLSLFDASFQKHTPALLKFLSEEKDKYTRLFIIETLGNIGSTEAISHLNQILKEDSDKYVRLRTLKSLDRIVPKTTTIKLAFIDALQDDYWLVCASAAKSLGQFGPNAKKAIPSLLKILERESKIQDVSPTRKNYLRYVVAIALSKIAPEMKMSLPFLFQALKENKANIRYNAVKALSRMNKKFKKEIIYNLEKTAKDSDEEVQRIIVETLANLKKENQKQSHQIWQRSHHNWINPDPATASRLHIKFDAPNVYLEIKLKSAPFPFENYLRKEVREGTKGNIFTIYEFWGGQGVQPGERLEYIFYSKKNLFKEKEHTFIFH